MAKKLDESKPYGVIFGEGLARFEQDGCYFGVDGIEIAAEGEAAAPPASSKKRGGQAPAPVETTELDEQLSAQADLI